MEELKDLDELYFYFQKCMQLKENRSRTLPAVFGSTEEMEHLVYHDVLTELKNRRAFEKDAEEMVGKGIPFWIISMDANNLKKVNDTYGHQHGDNFLKEIADSMAGIFALDHSYRFGGDEFAVLLPDKGEKEISELMEDLKSSLQSKQVAGLPVSISAGYALCRDGRYEEALEEADRKMYREKEESKKSLRKKTDTPGEKAMRHFSTVYGMKEIAMLYALAVLAAVLLN